MTSQQSSFKNKQDILETISKEAKSRPVIPFLGAGISISAGFPTIKYVVEYLAKVDFAITFGVFADRFPDLQNGQQETIDTYYRQHPSKYLEDFGWPEIGQINADLWDWLHRGLDSSNNKDFNGEGRKKIFEDSQTTSDNYKKTGDLSIFPDLLSNDILPNDKYINHSKKNNPDKQLELRDHIRAIVQWSLRKELAERESGTTRALLDEWLQWKHYYFQDTEKNTKPPKLLHGDWEMLLDRLCEGNFDLADTLFNSFEYGLAPTISHRYLAFLQPKLGMPLLLTTNFDSLLEHAFQEEGVPTKVFDIHRNAELPNPTLVCSQPTRPSLLKLHGSAYGLRFGERLKNPLEIDDRNNTLGYIPNDALVLVMGFNGSERRIMQMLYAIARKKSKTSTTPQLIWIQGPGDKSPLFKELIQDSNESIQYCEVRHIDTFLMELYFHITINSYQSSCNSYPTIPNRPLTTELEVPRPNILKEKKEARLPVQICLPSDDPNACSSNSSSLDAIAFTNSLDNGYTIIWVDLVNHHTVEGIVADFFKQVRTVDPLAPSCIFTSINQKSSLDKDNAEVIFSKVIERIRDVFKRGRFVFVLDSIESFGRPQMVHHGIPSFNKSYLVDNKQSQNNYYKNIKNEYKNQGKNLNLFLKLLLNFKRNRLSVADNYWDSYVVIAVNKYRPRHKNNPDNQIYLKVEKDLMEMFEKNKNDKYINFRYQKHKRSKLYFKNKENIPEDNPAALLSKHWRGIAGETHKKNSIKRAEDVINLLVTLRSDASEKVKTKDLKVKKTTEAFICLLSIFRRPRSLPLLRSIIERWGLRKIEENILDDKILVSAHYATNNLLRYISSENDTVGVITQNHEGGTIWLYREAYEATYDALTENIHAQNWKNTWSNKNNNSKELSCFEAIMDGILNITWHLIASRAYYVDVFLPTHDINAFYEYMYHRVSATRTITLLIKIIERENDKLLFHELNEYCKTLYDYICKLKKNQVDQNNCFEEYIILIGIFDPIVSQYKMSTTDDLLNNLRHLRRHSLETLLMAITKNSFLFRSVATPETVLAWSNQFLELELDNMKESIDNDLEINIDETIIRLEQLFKKFKYRSILSKMNFGDILGDYSEKILKDKEDDFEKEIIEIFDKGSMGDDTKEIAFKEKLDNLLNISRCLVDSSAVDAKKHSDFIFKTLSSVEALDRESHIWLKTKQRDALALRARSQFKDWAFWQPLLDRMDSTIYINSDVLTAAEQDSILYEDLLRETTETNDQDSKHRSTALTIRARSLYLRGHFPQAHHYLDLSSTGLHQEVLDHRSLISIVHIVRAELLAISAHEHYFSFNLHDQLKIFFPQIFSDETAQNNWHLVSKTCVEVSNILIQIATSSLKKIERGEHELIRAEKLLSTLTYQNNWLLQMEFGCVQVRLERMLFEIELLYLSWHSLSPKEYLKKTGELERNVLYCMQRLRNILDVIPYELSTWEAKVRSQSEINANRSLFKMECNVYKLWQQLYVVGSFFTSLLHSLHKETDSLRYNEMTINEKSDLLIPKIIRYVEVGDTAKKYLEQWKLWCSAMRFVQFGKTMTSSNAANSRDVNSNDSISLRATITYTMLKQSDEELIKEMWENRRKKESGMN